jgi:integrase
LNRLLTWIGRKERIALDRRPREPVRYMTLDDYEKVRRHLDPPLRRLADAAIYTGARVGELFCLTPASLRDNGRSVWIEWQLRRDTGEVSEIKNRAPHKAMIWPRGRERVAAWLATSTDERRELRWLKHAELLERACLAAGVPPVTFHDLRHCYAIAMVRSGVTLHTVAQFLGDTIAVVDEYYTGFVPGSDDIDAVEACIRRST